MADPADVNAYRMTLEELAESTGHAPGEELVEIEPEVEASAELPPRTTPYVALMSGGAYAAISVERPARRVRWGIHAVVGAAAFVLLVLVVRWVLS